MGYLGSKGGSGVFQAVIAAMPPHDTYIETHLGSGVVMRAKPASARQIGIDINPAAIDAWIKSFPLRRYGVCETYHTDAVAFLEAFDFAAWGRVLIYADPPYVLSTRTAADKHHYGAFDYTDADHRRLIACLRQVPASVILSGYPSALYDELLGDWRLIEFQAMTRGGPRTEQLRLNFPAGEVQWAKFAGANYVERQRIKRKAANWARMYCRCPPAERLAVLAAILAEHASAPEASTSQTLATVWAESAALATTDAGDDAEAQTRATVVDAENPARDPAQPPATVRDSAIVAGGYGRSTRPAPCSGR
jgi:DNA adenine methylase